MRIVISHNTYEKEDKADMSYTEICSQLVQQSGKSHSRQNVNSPRNSSDFYLLSDYL